MLLVSEVFRSIQGESTFSGWPFTFVRLAGCNLHCRWCDTLYAREGGTPRDMASLVEEACAGPPRVCVTGGEPLLQAQTPDLVAALLDAGLIVLVETNGSLPIDRIDSRAHRIVDLKPPSSGEEQANHWPNMSLLTARDELKIVVADREDFRWAVRTLAACTPLAAAPVNLSPAHGTVPPGMLADWILAEGLDARVNLQLHRCLWPEAPRGR